MSISKKICPLDFKEKISFVKGFVESEYCDYIRAFGLSDNSKLWQKFIILMLNKKILFSSNNDGYKKHN